MAQYSFKHALNKSIRKDKPIVLVVTFGRNVRRSVPTGIYVPEEQWDKTSEKIIRHPGSALLNAQLALKKKKLQELELSALQAGQPFTPQYLDRILHPEREVRQIYREPCFTDYMRKALARQFGVKLSTVQDQQKTLRRFASYFPNLLFKDFDFNILTEFERRCLSDKQARSTIAKHHKNLKKYLGLAAKEGVYSYPPGKHPYGLFKIQRAKGNRAFLSASELERLETLPVTAHLEIYRKMFLFICYTGLRISDFVRIDHSMLQDDILILKPVKTESTSSIEVHLPLRMLFGGKPYRIWESENFAFPTGAVGFAQKFNTALKLIARHAGIDKNLTCHVGRHTFLTHIAMKTGNVFTVMALGGLKKVDTAMTYIHLAEQDNRKALSGICW